jgi:hypothetical protein
VALILEKIEYSVIAHFTFTAEAPLWQGVVVRQTDIVSSPHIRLTHRGTLIFA